MTAEETKISFACSGCGRAFNVPASFAGRKATCKTCGTKVVVPDGNVEPLLELDAPEPEALEAEAPEVESPRITAAEPVAARSSNGNGAAPAAKPAASKPPTSAGGAPKPAAKPPSSLVVPGGAQVKGPGGPGKPGVAKPGAKKMVPKKPLRVRRMINDGIEMKRAFSDPNGVIFVKSSVGKPPETYQIEYKVTGLQKGWLGKPKKKPNHLVEIQLTSEYPRVAPQCKMLTPIFHPNIDENTICVGDHWTAGERLTDLVIRIAEMIAFQQYNIKSPLNGEAAMWADLNGDKLPVDPTNFHPGAEEPAEENPA